MGLWALDYCTGSANVAIGYGAIGKSTTSGWYNVAVGFNALVNNTSGYNNTAVGAYSLVANTTGGSNTTVGTKSLYNNTTGEFNVAIGEQTMESNTTGSLNVAIGSGALDQNTTGYGNAAGGHWAIGFNQTGNENTAFGEYALSGNLSGSYNTAVGCRSLFSVQNVSGSDSGFGQGDANTAIGYESLRDLTTGGYNVAMGMHALRVNSVGNSNIGLGYQSLTNNETGSNNVAVGNQSLFSNTTGNYNTIIGSGADVSQGDLTNVTVIGYGVKATESNKVFIGNADVTSIRSFAYPSTISDARVKKNVQNNVPGLDFINKLQPVTYNLDYSAINNLQKTSASQENQLTSTRADQQTPLYTGFIAQDVEKAAQSIGYDFDAIDVNKNNSNDLYGLKYSEFIAPLVKSVQELSEQNDEKDKAIAALQSQVNTLTDLVNKIMGNDAQLSLGNDVSVSNSSSLGQNFPNPYSESTTINYTLPQNFFSAKIVIADTSGKVFKQIPVSGPGTSSVKIEAGSLHAGNYLYSLYVDNTLIDTKKMVLTK